MQLLQVLLIMKKTSVNKKTFKIAYCALIASISTVLMLLTSFIPIGTYALPIFAGALLVSIVIEYNCKWALGVYAVVSILSSFLAGDKEAVVFFIALFGYYPILKNIIERYNKNAVVRWIIKLFVFNAAAVGSFFVVTLILEIPASEFSIFGVYLPYVFLLAGNVFFILYDLSINVFVRFYVQRLRNALFGRYL